MLCSDTGTLPTIKMEHLDVRSTKRLNKLIGILKAGFKGNGQLTLVFSGGHVDDIKFLGNDMADDRKQAS